MQIKSNYTFNKKKLKVQLFEKKNPPKYGAHKKKVYYCYFGVIQSYYSYNILSKCLKEENKQMCEGTAPFR